MKSSNDRPLWWRGLNGWAAPVMLAMALAFAGCEVEERAGDDVDAVAVDTTTAAPARTAADVKPASDAGGEQQLQGRALAVQTAKEGDTTRQFIMYPTGQRDTSVLMIEKAGPAEVRAGQPYNYQIRLTNLTAAPLAGVSLRQSLPHGLSIESAQPSVTRMVNAPPTTRPSQQQQEQQQQTAQATTQPSGQEQQVAGGATTQPSGQQQQVAGGATTQPSGQQQHMEFAVANWRIGELAPGETRTINVRAFASTVGTLPSCITADYEPTLCAVTQVTNPQLRLVKTGPQRADLCEPLAYRYTVANAGTGTARNVRIQDPLPEGLTTEDGQQQVAIEVGELPAGASKDFDVKLKPSRAGEFASRAVASSESDKVYSDNVATTIVRPNLALNIEAPESQYINERFTYRVTVTNNGTAPAEDAILKLNVGDGAEFVRIPTQGPQEQGQQAQAEGAGEAQLAAAQADGDDVAAGDAVRVGTLEPGQSKTLQLTFVGRQEGPAAIAAIANAECAEAAQASARTYIATIPALQLWVVDAQDPVKVGGETTYVVRLLNEGTGAANNISLSGNLPKGMTFVSGSGDTDLKAQGQNVNFGTIKTLAAGQQLEWRVQAKAEQAGDVQFRVQLKSDDTSKPVVSSEPTKLFE